MSIFTKIKEWVAPDKTYADLSASIGSDPKQLPAATTKQPEISTPQDIGDLVEMIIPRRETPDRGKRGVLTAFHTAPTFHACAKRVAESMAQIEWFVERDGQHIDDHVFLQIQKSPNPQMPGFIYRTLQQLYMDLLGETFDVMFTSPEGRLELWPIPPTAITRQDRGGKWEVRLGDYRDTFPDEQILHLSTPDLLNPYKRGKGIGSVLADEVETSEHIANHIKAQFYNGARPDLLIRLPGAGDDEQKRFKEQWIQRFQGARKGGAPAIIGDDAEDFIVEEISRSLADMESAELKQLQDALVRRTWGVPPEIMGISENSNRATIQQATKIMAKFVQIPRAMFWQSVWNHHLMPMLADDPAERIGFVDPTPADKESRQQKMTQTPWAFTLNEHRAIVGLPPREGGDVYMRPADNQMIEEDAGPVTGPAQQRSADDTDDDPPKPPPCCGSRSDDGDIIRLPWVKQEVDERARRAAEALRVEPLRMDLEPEVEAKMEAFVRDTFEEFPEGIDATELFFAVRPSVREHVQNFGADQIEDINSTTQDSIRTLVDDALKEGRNPRRIASNIGEYVQGTIPNRGEVIARTEMLRAQNTGRFATFEQSGLVEMKRWLTAMDGRQRAEHGELNGTTIPLKEPFKAGGSEAMHPGDFGGRRAASLNINCRCGIRAVFPELENTKSIADDTIIKKLNKQFDEATNDFEQSVLAAFDRQFNEFFWPRFEEIFDVDLERAI